MRPRPYLSFSQMTTFEQSPDRFVKQYLEGEGQRVSRNIVTGKRLANALENEEADGDPLLDLVAAKLPKFERMDKPVEDPKGTKILNPHDGKEYLVPTLKNTQGDDVPLLALPDTAKADYMAFKEYKTSVRKWTQKMVDESGQITFYATAIWIATGKIPSDIELVCAETEYDANGRVVPTGNITAIPTQRRMSQIIKMTLRIRKAWAGIKELTEENLL